jgi:hypothetical protein
MAPQPRARTAIRWRRIATATAVLAAIAGAAAAAADGVALRVTPYKCLEPCTVRVTVHTAPDPDVRALVVELDSADFFRSSLIQLDGGNSPTLHLLEFPSLPAGVYAVRAVLTGVSQSRSVDQVAVTVAGPG